MDVNLDELFSHGVSQQVPKIHGKWIQLIVDV